MSSSASSLPVFVWTFHRVTKVMRRIQPELEEQNTERKAKADSRPEWIAREVDEWSPSEEWVSARPHLASRARIELVNATPRDYVPLPRIGTTCTLRERVIDRDTLLWLDVQVRLDPGERVSMDVSWNRGETPSSHIAGEHTGERVVIDH
jgi:hypothetical protein